MGYPNIACPKCGVIGEIQKYGHQRGKQRYYCNACWKILVASALPELANEREHDQAEVGTVAAKPYQPTQLKAPAMRPGAAPVAASGKADKVEPFLLEMFSDIQAIYKQPGGELPVQQILQVVRDFKSESEKPEVRLNCPGCGKPMQKTGKNPVRWRCNTHKSKRQPDVKENCEYYGRRDTQAGWEKIIRDKGASK